MSPLHFYDRVAAHTLRSRHQRADHSSIPDGNQPHRQILAPYDDSTPPGSSSGYSKSASPDQRCFQARPPTRLGTSANGGNDAAYVADRYPSQRNHPPQPPLPPPPTPAPPPNPPPLSPPPTPPPPPP